MARYQVPQFIDIEDKILGPLTLRQFLYFMTAAAILFILWTLLKLNYFIIGATIIGGTAILFAFVKINGQPFSRLIVNLINFILRPQKYIWRREQLPAMIENDTPPATPQKPKTQYSRIKKPVSESKLKKLAWELNKKEDQN